MAERLFVRGRISACLLSTNFEYNLGPAGVELKVGVLNKRKRKRRDIGE